ncbi:mannose-6-phosphate isomerase, class I [Hoyosella rhizosphaerae]|uniref:mannose-6-phosphate isomerase n=1 Tax=Hoyosella rhizosphaerae TaxID=1755582 RepID=A0A916XDP1_9ACTN|nr:mannose-6-phosphate isomerase, class I [Hoyosella rhizosphaerae]MBN4926003.1 mannose-6-phosphate isomerase, class I [Hoyosella rhizosphaerae]GGC66313.1 putative mannose-6-phosphate isomerase ManA [Hoyosella rhizosphaerae]
MHALECAVRNYAWGSRTALAQLRGVPSPTDHPEAELWMGAHPADPARLVGGDSVGVDKASTLLSLIDSDPVSELGVDVCERFDKQLPFLMKILAAEEPLSLQAHPSREQAQDGYARENSAGVKLAAHNRNYKDKNHKPELIVALTPFAAMAGFRDPHETVRLLRALDCPKLEHYCGILAGQPDSDGLRTLFTTWITLPQAQLSELLDDVTTNCIRYLSEKGGAEFAGTVKNLLQLVERYPGDAGVLAAMLLNHVTLEPGEGIFLEAGVLHAYLYGVGVELMANSDNVLRGGLTPKYVDVPELMRVVDFHPLDVTPVELRNADPGGTAERVYSTPTSEFRLSRIDLDATGLHHSVSHSIASTGPQIVVCTRGSVTATCGSSVYEIPQGGAVWVSAVDPEVVLHARTAHDQVFRALVP